MFIVLLLFIASLAYIRKCSLSSCFHQITIQSSPFLIVQTLQLNLGIEYKIRDTVSFITTVFTDKLYTVVSTSQINTNAILKHDF